ncbi:MAG: Na/Pi cotransporter family protein, partial [Candidatus Tectomicrobia bacterium]
MVAAPVFGAASGAGDISWGFMAMELFGGLALFLFGMEQMCSALKAVAGNRMRAVLEGLTTNRVVGLLTGLGVTSVIQSSSVTTVMLVGFVSAGLMSLSQSIGVILGADIGTTITAQIIAFKVTKYALLLIGIGFIPIFIAKSDETRQYGTLVMGLGMIFLGMFVMTTAMKPLRTYEPFLELMQHVANPAIGILIATLFTGLMQSSSAAMGVILALALQGLISLEAGIALALGANIGTCITAGLAAIGKPREAVRVAVAHVTFKVLGVLLIVLFIPPFADLVRAISPAEPGLTGLDRLAAETPRQIANAHTLFNVGIALLFLPLTTQFARFCEWVVPDRPVGVEEPAAELKPKYLDETLLSTASLALSSVRLEIGRLGERVKLMFDKIFSAALFGDEQELQAVVDIDEDVDSLHGHIVMFLGKLSMTKLSAREAEELMDLIQAVNYLEHIGDIIQNNMKTLGMRRIEERIVVSERTM